MGLCMSDVQSASRVGNVPPAYPSDNDISAQNVTAAGGASISIPSGDQQQSSVFRRYVGYVAAGYRGDVAKGDLLIGDVSSSLPRKVLGNVGKAVIVVGGSALRVTGLLPLLLWAKEISDLFLGWVLEGGLGKAVQGALSNKAVHNAVMDNVGKLFGGLKNDVGEISRPYAIAYGTAFVAGAVGTVYQGYGAGGPADAVTGGLLVVTAAAVAHQGVVAAHKAIQSVDLTSEEVRPKVIAGATIFATTVVGATAAVAYDYAVNAAETIPYAAAIGAAFGAVGALGVYYGPAVCKSLWSQPDNENSSTDVSANTADATNIPVNVGAPDAVNGAVNNTATDQEATSMYSYVGSQLAGLNEWYLSFRA